MVGGKFITVAAVGLISAFLISTADARGGPHAGGFGASHARAFIGHRMGGAHWGRHHMRSRHHMWSRHHGSHHVHHHGRGAHHGHHDGRHVSHGHWHKSGGFGHHHQRARLDGHWHTSPGFGGKANGSAAGQWHP
jgi:hypothetical protein